jgi:hypothetical protein
MYWKLISKPLLLAGRAILGTQLKSAVDINLFAPHQEIPAGYMDHLHPINRAYPNIIRGRG